MNHTQYFNFPLFEETDKPSWLTDWNGLVSALDNDLETLRTSILANSGEITAIGTSIARINNDIDELKIVTDTLTTSTENLMGSVNIIQNTLLQIDSEVKSLSTRITNLDTSVDARLTELENSVEDIVTNISSFRNEFETFLNAIVKEYNSEDYYQKFDFVYIVRDGVKSYYMTMVDNPTTAPPSGGWASSFKVADIASYARRLAETNKLKLNDVRSAIEDILSSFYAKWESGVTYAIGNYVFVQTGKYENLALPVVAKCLEAHTSGIAFDDTKWKICDFTNATSDISSSLIGNIYSRLAFLNESINSLDRRLDFAENDIDRLQQYHASRSIDIETGCTTTLTAQSFYVQANLNSPYLLNGTMLGFKVFVNGNATTNFVPTQDIEALAYLVDTNDPNYEVYKGVKKCFVSYLKYNQAENITEVGIYFLGGSYRPPVGTESKRTRFIFSGIKDINGHAFNTSHDSDVQIICATAEEV